jgi:NAD(P)-dependent dehydrogenase (short-subunit alcohol dehydrogenase family)
VTDGVERNADVQMRGQARCRPSSRTSVRPGDEILLALADSASKAAVIGLTKWLGEELATTGLLVNAITLSSPRHCATRCHWSSD